VQVDEALCDSNSGAPKPPGLCDCEHSPTEAALRRLAVVRVPDSVVSFGFRKKLRGEDFNPHGRDSIGSRSSGRQEFDMPASPSRVMSATASRSGSLQR